MKFDIGIYFEANGHGTVVFSDKFDKLIRRCAFQFSLRNLFSEKKSTLIKYFSRADKSSDAQRRLHYLSMVINEVSMMFFLNVL